MNRIISIIICTRNHADSLRETLLAIGKVEVPLGWEVEIVVADNGSTDQTREVVEETLVPNMSVKRVVEPVTGQSRARNLGLSASSGDIIVFTDDDVRPSVCWLAKLCEPLMAGTADGVQGGVFLPPSRRFSWMKRLHFELFASTEFFSPGEVKSMWGANFAFRREALACVPAFDIELGPGALGFADDSLFSIQLREAGNRLIYVPEAAVEHWFDCSRLTMASLRSRAFRDGQSRAYVDYHWEHESADGSKEKLQSAKRAILRHYVKRPWRLMPNSVLNEAEFWLQIGAGYWTQMEVEKHRPRRYAKRGLRLLEQET